MRTSPQPFERCVRVWEAAFPARLGWVGEHGKERVLARLGWAGEMTTSLNILLPIT